MSWLMLLGRLLFGGYFVLAGLDHFTRGARFSSLVTAGGVPVSSALVMIAGALLVLGGVSLVLGLAPRIGLALLLLYLVPAAFTLSAFWAAPEAARLAMSGQFGLSVCLIGACFALLAVSVPWAFSVDELLRRRWPSWPQMHHPTA
ncbi:MAG: DoxX family protein [Archangium sp.]|nr:DoxX family protein [Archangium sp.]MDP3574194.1 DoxX family protein [Archangium sp.]